MASSAKEDYLKAIYELEQKMGVAKTNRIAEKLGVRAATVSEMIRRMSNDSPRLVAHKHHQGVRLTTLGKKTAMEIIRRHRLLETFLHRTLGLSWNEVHEEAEVLEHHISDRLTEAIDTHLGFPRYDPHGEPIPDREGNLILVAQHRLTDVAEGEKFRIVRVDPASSELLAYLESLNIGIHSNGIMISKSPLDGPIRIIIDPEHSIREHVLGRNITNKIYVKSNTLRE